MNSRNKGKVGEREFAAFLREHGFMARRGQQFAGGANSPDVVCDALAWLHIEVKRTQALNLTDACAQAEGDCGGKPWIVAHRRNYAPWLVTLTAEVFCEVLRGDYLTAELAEYAERDGTCGTGGTNGTSIAHADQLPGLGAEGEDGRALTSAATDFNGPGGPAKSKQNNDDRTLTGAATEGTDNEGKG